MWSSPSPGVSPRKSPGARPAIGMNNPDERRTVNPTTHVRVMLCELGEALQRRPTFQRCCVMMNPVAPSVRHVNARTYRRHTSRNVAGHERNRPLQHVRRLLLRALRPHLADRRRRRLGGRPSRGHRPRAPSWLPRDRWCSMRRVPLRGRTDSGPDPCGLLGGVASGGRGRGADARAALKLIPRERARAPSRSFARAPRPRTWGRSPGRGTRAPSLRTRPSSSPNR